MIGGNTEIQIQQAIVTKNEIGEGVQSWSTVVYLKGWLDLQGGQAGYTNFNTKIQESTHVFVSDYADLSGITAENSRVIDANNNVYDVMLIDDPMGMHYQSEIYLKYTGGQ